jgi:regulator of sigma E protease
MHMAIALLILGVILFIGLVVVHEWGHFIFARRNGVEVEEFGIGFPPKAWGKKIKSPKGDYIFSINWLPLGGFVRLKGEHDSDTEKGTFGAASLAAKTKIMAAGVGMNFLAALVLFTIVAWIGMPQIIDNQFTVASDSKVVREPDNKDQVKIGAALEGGPAQKVGIQAEDRIVSIAGTKIVSPEQMARTTAANKGQEVAVVVERGNRQQTYQVTLNQSSPYLGVSQYSAEKGFEMRRSTWSAPVVAVGVTYDFTIATVKGLGKALAGVGSIIAGAVTGNSQARTNGQTEASNQVSGPVGIFAVLYAGAEQGIGFILFVIGIISLSLAIMNILPIPALDGGKLFVTYMHRLLGRRVSEKFENYAYGISFMLLIGLMVLITIVDVKRFF